MLRGELKRSVLLLLLALLVGTARAQQTAPVQRIAAALSDTTRPRPSEEELSVEMRAGIARYLDRHADQVIRQRDQHWNRDFSSPVAYRRSVQPNLERFRTITGVVDERVPEVTMQRTGHAPGARPTLVAETDRYAVHQVRWPTLDGIDGAGLLLTPKGDIRARVVALPDAGQTPEQIVGLASGVPASQQFARRLAESGVQVVVPALINRQSTFSGSDQLIDRLTWDRSEPVSAWTNQPHREWIYRQAFQMGRHVIGYEVQKALAAIDWFEAQGGEHIGVAGYGEGGLLAFYAAAMDKRIDAAWVSGYFGPREALWKEPVYRNVWGLLQQFGDAEVASLIAPRALIVEHSAVPDVEGPPPAQENERAVAAPGRLTTPSLETVEQEVARGRGFFPEEAAVQPDVQLIAGAGPKGTVETGSEAALGALLERLDAGPLAAAGPAPTDRRDGFAPSERQQRQIQQISDHLQEMVRGADRVRYAFIEGERSSPAAWDASMEKYRDHFWNEILGRLPAPSLAPHPRMRKVYDKETWTGYEVMLDVWPDVFSFGILAVPKDIQEGEKRPVVVTQHGVEGLPRHTVRPEPDGSAGTAYNSYASRLAERGFVVFAPHNPSRGGTRYRLLERRANPLKASIFSVILAQHQQILRWLRSLDYVDPGRIGFYGLSWGGRTAIRVPALLTDYALSITSGDFNRWNEKVMTTHYRNSYLFSSAFETYEFDLGNTFDHAELAGLIAPRPFMVESGYRDVVAADAWVGYEYAKVRRLYDYLGIPERTRLEFFQGRHEIHGEGTFDFLHQHLDWPRPQLKQNAE